MNDNDKVKTGGKLKQSLSRICTIWSKTYTNAANLLLISLSIFRALRTNNKAENSNLRV